MPRTKDPRAPELVRACISLDNRTRELLGRITHKFNLTKKEAFTRIAKLAIKNEIKLSDVTKFHQEVWTKLSTENDHVFSQVGFDWFPDENEILLTYAKHLFGRNNRSEAMRVLVAYYAIQNKLATVLPESKLTIK